MPCENAKINIVVKGHPIELQYSAKSADGKRSYFIDDEKAVAEKDNILCTNTLYIKDKDLHDNMVIRVEG